MHDAVVVIRDSEVVDNLRAMTFEVVRHTGYDVLVEDIDVIITVCARLFVVEPQGVAQLVSNHPPLWE